MEWGKDQRDKEEGKRLSKELLDDRDGCACYEEVFMDTCLVDC